MHDSEYAAQLLITVAVSAFVAWAFGLHRFTKTPGKTLAERAWWLVVFNTAWRVAVAIYQD
jgi:hypothetical protein